MKNFMMSLGLLFTLNALATTEYVPEEQGAKPSPARVQTTRSCWQELQAQGCGDPSEDMTHFRSCMNNAYDSLTADCKTMMSKLYSKK